MIKLNQVNDNVNAWVSLGGFTQSTTGGLLGLEKSGKHSGRGWTNWSRKDRGKGTYFPSISRLQVLFFKIWMKLWWVFQPLHPICPGVVLLLYTVSRQHFQN